MSRPRILLINPWITDFAAVNMWARPLGLLQIAEQLSAFNVDLQLIDCMDDYQPGRKGMYEFPKTPLPAPEVLQSFPRTFYRYGMSEDEFDRCLQECLPVDVVLITCIMTYWYPGAFDAIQRCQKVMAKQRVPIILGGIYARLFPEHARRFSGADVVHTGPGHADLLQCLAGLGVPLRKQRPPQPYYRLGFYTSLPYAPLWTSSGCPLNCAYCASRILQPVFKQKPAASIFQTVVELASLGTRDFAFYDDALLVRASHHLNVLLTAVIQANLPVRFHTPNGLHARFLTRKTAALMKAARFFTLRLSLESVRTERQKHTGAKVTSRELIRAVEALRAEGFSAGDIGTYLLVGLPGQTEVEVWEGIHFLENLGVRIHLSEFSPLPGTRAWQEVMDSGYCPHRPDPLLTNNTVFTRLFAGYGDETLKAWNDAVAKNNQRFSSSLAPRLVRMD